MFRIRNLFVIPILTSFFAAGTQPAAAQTAPSNDQEIETLRAEILSAHIAMMNAQDDAVKDLAVTIVRDDTKALETLRGVPERQKPAKPGNESENHPGLTAEHRQELERLSNLSAQNFDHEYLENLIGTHEQLIRDLERAPDTSTVARATVERDIVPVMKHDLSEAKQIEKGAGARK